MRPASANLLSTEPNIPSDKTKEIVVLPIKCCDVVPKLWLQNRF